MAIVTGTRINPVMCADCAKFTSHHAHGGGAGVCSAGWHYGAVALWAKTRRVCKVFVKK